MADDDGDGEVGTRLDAQRSSCPESRALRDSAERPARGRRPQAHQCTGYVFQALVTSMPTTVAPLTVWRDYNGRSDCENVIKELHQGFALPTLCLRSFWATEAALTLATLTYNRTVLFQRNLGWQTKVTIQSLRFWLFIHPRHYRAPGRQNLDQAGRASSRTRLVAQTLGQDPQPVSQLQCSRESTRLLLLKWVSTAQTRLSFVGC